MVEYLWPYLEPAPEAFMISAADGAVLVLLSLRRLPELWCGDGADDIGVAAPP